jgi:autotransporter-associated beta strand protein
VVDTALDENDGNYSPGHLSLREAIGLANARVASQIAHSDTITFAHSLNGQPIDLSLGELTISQFVTIIGNGAGNTIIDAQQLSRIFDIAGSAGDVTLDGLTLQNGRTTGTGENGGAIRFLSAGTLTINDSTITANATTGSPADGGAIFDQSGTVVLNRDALTDNFTQNTLSRGGAIAAAAGAVSVNGSLFSGNFTIGGFSFGGAIYTSRAAVTITNSTLSGNSTTGPNADGGAIDDDHGALTVNNSTIVGNSAQNGAGGGISGNAGAIVLRSSILAGNTDIGGFTPDLQPSASVTVRNSLIGNNAGAGLSAGFPDANGNLIGTSAIPIDPRLGPLADNGGPTQTRALQNDSPAIDAGSNLLNLATDERGRARQFGPSVDIGAFEFESPNADATISITSNGGGATAAISMSEETVAVTTVVGTDTDSTATISYGILPAANGGGADGAVFAIDSTTGLLTFVAPPDYLFPRDANRDNIYKVTVEASDGLSAASQTIAVAVTNLANSANLVYVSSEWSSLTTGTVIANPDPSVPGSPSAIFGVNAFALIQGGADAVSAGGTVTVLPGNYSSGAMFIQPFNLNVPTGLVTISAPLQGSVGLLKTGSGTLSLGAANDYSGSTTVAAGTLLVNGSLSAASAVTVLGTLGGSGTVAGVVSVGSQGAIAPGGATPAMLTTGILTLGSGTLSLDLPNHTTYDSVSTSAVNLTGATLAVNFGTVNAGDSFTILSIAGTAPSSVSGRFANLPTSGSTFTVGAVEFAIIYTGGDGNDVILFAVSGGSAPSLLGSPILNGNSSYINNTNFAQQHSIVESAVYSFSTPVSLTASDFTLAGINGTTLAPTVNLASSGGGTVWTVTFSGDGVNGATGSIGDGEYRLTLPSFSSTFDFYRLLGDMDGNGTVDTSDFATLISTFLRATNDPLYLGADDLDGDHQIGTADFAQFTQNFLKSVPSPLPPN